MFLVEGLYKRIEILSEHLCLFDKKYNKENELLSKDIEECRKFKEKFNEFIEDIKDLEDPQLLDKYFDFVDKDLSLDLKTTRQKFKVNAIKDEIFLIKSDIVNSVNTILENSNEYDYNNINERICNSLEYDDAKETVNSVFLQKRIERKK